MAATAHQWPVYLCHVLRRGSGGRRRVSGGEVHVPAEDSEDKVHYKERADDDEADEVDPRPSDSHCIVDLQPQIAPVGRQRRDAPAGMTGRHDGPT